MPSLLLPVSGECRVAGFVHLVALGPGALCCCTRTRRAASPAGNRPQPPLPGVGRLTGFSQVPRGLRTPALHRDRPVVGMSPVPTPHPSFYSDSRSLGASLALLQFCLGKQPQIFKVLFGPGLGFPALRLSLLCFSPAPRGTPPLFYYFFLPSYLVRSKKLSVAFQLHFTSQVEFISVQDLGAR